MKLLINGFNTLGFAVPIISELFMFIDHLIYWCANLAFQTFYEIANLSAGLSYQAPEVVSIMQRLMVLAGIYALFRVAVMLINYLINPDKVGELSKGSSSVVSRIVIAIVLLIACQFIFQQLGRFQNLIINNDVIPKLVYGPRDEDIEESVKISDQTERFVNNVWLLFYRPKGKDCDTDHSGSCIAYNRVKNGDTGSILSLVGANYTDFEYFPVISGIVGIVLIYYFVKFAVSLGVRVFKLFVLQVIAPIPIIMSIDPARKNQVSVFAKTYFGVYIQVFLRIFTFYLAFVAIDILGALPGVISDATSTGVLMASNLGLFTQVLLIFAVFQAAQELPKLIEEALSVKLGLDTGSKGFGGILKGIIGGTAGLVGGAVAGGVAGGVGGALAGGASGMWNAGIGAAAGKNAAAGISATVAAVGKSHQLGGRIANTGGLLPFARSGVENFFGANKKDASEIARFDRLSGDQDKLIEGYNSSMGERSTVDQLRGGIDTALDSAFAASAHNRRSLETFINSDGEYSALQTEFQKDFGVGGRLENDSTARQNALNRISAKRAQLEDDYKGQRQRFGELQFSKYQRNIQNAGTPGFVPENVDANFKKALEDYNSYVTQHDMSDRTISSYTRSQGARSLEEAKDINDRNKVDIQRQIDDANREKERIANEKKAFQEDPRVAARANRDKPRDAKPWN